MALSKRGILTLSYPVQKGKIVNFDDVEKIMHTTFYDELRQAPEECPTVFALSPFESSAVKEKITQIIFETFNAPAFYMVSSATAALFDYGKSTGLVIDSGAEATNVVSIKDGKMLKDSSVYLPYGGKDLTNYLQQLLTYRGYSFTTSAEMEIVKSIKHDFCYVSQDYQRDLDIDRNLFSKAFELPDGQPCQLDQERFKCPEALFDPQLLGLSEPAIHTACISAINKSGLPELFQNVVLAGGNTCFPGLKNRLVAELKAGSGQDVVVSANPHRAIAAWSGARKMSEGMKVEDFISIDAYNEIGPTIIHEKCPF